MLLGAREAYLNYIPFSNIALEEQPYRFRQQSAEFTESLEASLKRSGQTHPLTLLEISPEKFLVLDGHRRCDTIRSIREKGGTWDKILAQVVAYESFGLVERFRLLREKNMLGDYPYALTERGQFFSDFLSLGMSVREISNECMMLPGQVEDTVDLAKTPPELAVLLNSAAIEPTFALMLLRRYVGWAQTPHAGRAIEVARKLIAHVKREKLTVKSWRFLLDFYWAGDRPFLTDPL